MQGLFSCSGKQPFGIELGFELLKRERKRPNSVWDSLTPTELDVVARAAKGLSNREIGEQMFISAGTVKTHLAHVFAKLDVANRTELTAAHARADRCRAADSATARGWRGTHRLGIVHLTLRPIVLMTRVAP